MAKVKSSYFCQSCGAQSPKWLGKCNACGEWNTLVEEIIQKEDKPSWNSSSLQISKKPKPISQITYDEEKRLTTLDQELNRTLGGGIVPGSLVLIGGEPGIGKSTLMLQAALNLVTCKVL
jgi:DNA repair protein RadA/Sms